MAAETLIDAYYVQYNAFTEVQAELGEETGVEVWNQVEETIASYLSDLKWLTTEIRKQAESPDERTQLIMETLEGLDRFAEMDAPTRSPASAPRGKKVRGAAPYLAFEGSGGLRGTGQSMVNMEVDGEEKSGEAQRGDQTKALEATV